MSQVSGALAALGNGVQLAIQFNPLVALVTVVVAAALAGFPKAKSEHRHRATVALVTGWLVGDGLHVLGRTRDVFDGVAAFAPAGSPLWATWLLLLVWAAGSLLLGYATPALAGASVGRRVTFGTGWLAAGTVAAAVSVSLSAIVGAL